MTVKELREKLDGVPDDTPVAVGLAGEFFNVFEKGVRLGRLVPGYYPEEDMEEATRETDDITVLYLIVEND